MLRQKPKWYEGITGLHSRYKGDIRLYIHHELLELSSI